MDPDGIRSESEHEYYGRMKINWLDVLLVLPLVVGLVRGLMRGFISEIIAIVVVILGVLGARYGAPTFSAWLLPQFAWPKEVCDIVAYTLLFLGVAIVLSILARLVNKLIRAIHLNWINRLLGAVFGVSKYALIVLFAVFVMDKTNESFHWLDNSPIVQSSVVYPQMVKATHAILSFSGK